MASPAQHNSAPEDSAFPPFETEWFASQLFWLAICFGFFYLVLARFILPRLGEVIEHRQNRIAKDIDEAERIQLQTNKITQARTLKLREAHIQSQNIIAKTKIQNEKNASEKNKSMIEELERKISATQNEINEKNKLVLKNLDNTIQEITAAIIKKLTDLSCNTKDLKKPCSQALEKILH